MSAAAAGVYYCSNDKKKEEHYEKDSNGAFTNYKGDSPCCVPLSNRCPALPLSWQQGNGSSKRPITKSNSTVLASRQAMHDIAQW